MASSFAIFCTFATFLASISYAHCTEGCHGYGVKNSIIDITGEDLFGKPEDVKFEMNDCTLTLTEDLHFKEIQSLTVKYFVKKGAMKKEGEYNVCEGLENHSDDKDLKCLMDIIGTKSCPIPEKPIRGSCDFSQEHFNMRLAQGKTEFEFLFQSDRGEATMKGWVDIEKVGKKAKNE